MKIPTPIETIHNAYGDKGVALAESVILMVTLSAQIATDLKEEAESVGNPLAKLVAAVAAEELAQTTGKTVRNLVRAMLESDEVGSFMAACEAESDHRETKAHAVADLMGAVMFGAKRT